MDDRKLKKLLGELVKEGHLQGAYDPRVNDYTYKLTDKGLKYIKDLLAKDLNTQFLLFAFLWNDIVDNREELLKNPSGLALIINLLLKIEKDIGENNLKAIILGMRLKYEKKVKRRRGLAIPELLVEIYKGSPKSWDDFIKNMARYRKKDGLFLLMGDILALKSTLMSQGIDLYELTQKYLAETEQESRPSYIY